MSLVSPEAASAGRDLVFAHIEHTAELAASYAHSLREAAFRGDQTTIEAHVKQLRLCVVELITSAKSLSSATG